MTETEALSHVEVAPYDPAWPARYAAEREVLLTLGGALVLVLEHIGSTAVPGLRAKPIIDMMAATASLADASALASRMEARGYQPIETGMTDRLFLRRRAEEGLFQLHLVEHGGWAERHERLMRDHLIGHPSDAAAYGELKTRLAEQYPTDSLAYTKAKTAFVQGIVDRARARLGLPPIDVWGD